MSLGEQVQTDPIRVDFLVYGECVCGWAMATHAGGNWPKCPRCGERVHPTRDLPGRRPGARQGYGYVAELRPEMEAYTDSRCEVTDAYRPPPREGEKVPLMLGGDRMAYRVLSSERVQRSLAEREERRRADVMRAWRRRNLGSFRLRTLPLRYWLHPGTYRAVVCGWCCEYTVEDAAALWAIADGTFTRNRRKRAAHWVKTKLERRNAG